MKELRHKYRECDGSQTIGSVRYLMRVCGRKNKIIDELVNSDRASLPCLLSWKMVGEKIFSWENFLTRHKSYFSG